MKGTKVVVFFVGGGTVEFPDAWGIDTDRDSLFFQYKPAQPQPSTTHMRASFLLKNIAGFALEVVA